MVSRPSVSELALEANFSNSKLTRLFRQIFGTEIFQYYQAFRMKEAARLLKANQLLVSEIGCKYHPHQWPIGTATKYFLLSNDELPWFLKRFPLVHPASRSLQTENLSGFDQGSKTPDSFLAKLVNQQTIELLKQSISLRVIARRTGVAINTVRKMNTLVTFDKA